MISNPILKGVSLNIKYLVINHYRSTTNTIQVELNFTRKFVLELETKV